MKDDREMVLPFEAQATGTFNGDMFYDWYRTEPTNEKELRFWDFLHDWEKSIKKQNAKKLDEILKKIEELS
jgi:hypothetical protein